MLVRETPPLRLNAQVKTPDGYVRRWAADEPSPDNALGSLTFSSTMPGGFEQASASLARKLIAAMPDLEEFSTVTIQGVGGHVAWEGRLESSPRTWGQSSGVQPQLVGWQAHLDDDHTARMIPVDVDRSRWQAASVQRKINKALAGVDVDDPSTATDTTTGYPSVVTALAGPWGRDRTCEAWYDSGGIDLAQMYYAWKIDGNINPADPNWEWFAELSSDDLLTAGDSSGNLVGAGPGTGTLLATTSGRKFALAMLRYTAAQASQINFQEFWTVLAVYGDHNLPLYGTGDAQNAPGVLASDVIAHAVGQWAPQLAYTVGIDGTIIPSDFVIPHLTFLDPTTVSQIVAGASAPDLQQFAVWEGPTFYWAPWGTFGRKWRARVGPAQLQETGPSAQRIWNGAIVTYTDDVGLTRSVGPPGSGCNTEDATLLDPDPSNPANQAGLKRYSPPFQMGTGTVDFAIKLGQSFLQEQKLLDTSGQASHVAIIEDEHGVTWPAWQIRAGDEIAYVDSSDPSYRRVIRAEYDDSSKTCQVSLDAPPDGLQALLARLNVELAPLGL